MTRPARWTSSVALLLTLSAFALTPNVAQAKKGDITIGVGPNFYFDDATVSGRERQSIQVTEIDFDYTNDTYFAGDLFIVSEVIDNLRLGGGLKYLGPYEYITAEEAEEDDPNVVRIGQLIELTIRVEYLLELATFEKTMSLDLLLGAELGMALLFPDGDLQREIDQLQNQGADAWDTPRLGYVVGPQVGMRFKYNDTLAFRFNVAFNWEQLFLFAINENVNGVDFELERRADIIRVHFGIGIEASL